MKKNLLKSALEFAKERHKYQKYNEGNFIAHPILTAQILELIGADEKVVAAGYLHDILEDTTTAYQELVNNFGREVADIVVEVTKAEYNTFPMLKTLNGVLVLFASRLANLAHIKSWSKEKQKEYILKSKFWDDFEDMKLKKQNG